MAILGAVPRQAMGPKRWLVYALATTILWGVWGAFTGLPEERGFPETLVYCVWSLTMLPPAIYALARADWQLDCDARSLIDGMIIGLLGAGGQMVTIALSFLLLRERTNSVGTAGIVLALIALPLFDFSLKGLSEGSRLGWFLLSLIVMAAWGVQAYFMKAANHHMRAESIFFYMTVAGIVLAPLAWAMTDFTRPINWGADGPYLAAATQMLNAIGALTLVYAFRYGQAIVVSPLTNAGAPLMTAVISLVAIGALPSRLKLVAIALACIAALLLALTPEDAASDAKPSQASQ
jgi:drug/metabolite transporter (DMT)-like permease